VPVHHAPSAGQRTGAVQRGRPSGADAKDTLARRYHALGDVAAGVHAATGGAGATPATAPDPVSWGTGTVFYTNSAKLRAQVVPKEPPEPAQATQPEAGEAKIAHRTERPSWVRLLKRVFDIDLAHCPNCGGTLTIIAAILDRAVIEKILTHLGLEARAPPRAPARGQMPLYSA
jgi:hypothetical protein